MQTVAAKTFNVLSKLGKKTYFAFVVMRKLAAILLLAIFAFNLFGYKLYSSFAEQQALTQLTHTLDTENYDNNDLLLITKEINLPYFVNTTQFTEADGETEINGVFYRFVKYRIYNDKLEMLCIPDVAKTKIRDAKNNYFSVIADIEKNKNGKSTPTKNTSAKKAFSDFEENLFYSINVISNINFAAYNTFKNATAVFAAKAVAEQPPDLFA
jgi:hypothetical protein